MYKRVLVAIDVSEQSCKIIDHAVAIAKKFFSELTLLTVIPIIMNDLSLFDYAGESMFTGLDVDKYQDRVTKFYKNILIDIKTRVRSENTDLKVNTILREGYASKNIVDVAENDGYDLIIIGSRGIGGITGWILGSTSRRIIDSCTKPVLIIK